MTNANHEATMTTTINNQFTCPRCPACEGDTKRSNAVSIATDALIAIAENSHADADERIEAAVHLLRANGAYH